MANRLERIQRNFLWGSSKECFKYSLVAWEKVCSPLVMGDGSHILFWHDRWVGDISLKILYPQLYACLNDKEACIFYVLCHRGVDMIDFGI